MPKIIKNLREDILRAAKKQISISGYKNTTIRSVAVECNIATGTVYNYFGSKETLIASFILEDWVECTKLIAEQPVENRQGYLAFIYFTLKKFSEKYSSLFSDKDAKKEFGNVFFERHKILREQLANLILPICMGENPTFLSKYVAEALLTWTMEGVGFDQIYALLPEEIK